MKIVVGNQQVPVIYSAHHASHEFGKFADRLALSSEQSVRFSDYGTAQTVPVNGIATLIAEHSRALGDLNRDPDDPARFAELDYGQPERHAIWQAGQELTEADKLYCQTSYYEPFHGEIIRQLSARTQPTFVVTWDNTAHYEIGRDSADQPVIMKPIILSNRGRENSAQAGPDEETSCDPVFLEILARHLAPELADRGLPSAVHLNLVMRGGYICRNYSSRRNRAALAVLGVSCDVQSLQVEYDTAITHDQRSLKPIEGRADALREAFEAAIGLSFAEYS